jgi:hypothetical protein
MIYRRPAIVTSVEPLEGHEGTIVTLKGSGFAAYPRNNCVVIGGMGACARAQPGSTATELKVKISPVAKETQGDLLMWPGPAVELHPEEVKFGETSLLFSDVAVFRNGAPQTSAGIAFKLTKASPNTYGGYLEKSARSSIDLGGYESGSVMKLSFPKDLSLSKHRTVDICLVLKEPTLAVDFSAEISGRPGNEEECLRAIAKSICLNAGLVGEKVFAGVMRNPQNGEYELFVTKPYLERGMLTMHFSSNS